MASNQYINKVQCENNILIDLTGDTVTASSLVQGYTAHAANGAPISGTIPNGDLLGYGKNTSPIVNVAKANQAVVNDYYGDITGRAFSDMAVLAE